jgi:hypothetical protein
MARIGNRYANVRSTSGITFTAIDAYGAPLADPARVRSGADVVFVVSASDPADSRRYTADIARDGEVLVSGVPVDPTYALQLDDVSVEHAGEWTATLMENATPVAASTLTLHVRDVSDGDQVDDDLDAERDATRDRRRFGDPDLEVTGAIAALVAFVLIGGITAAPIWARGDDDVPVVWYIALGLFLVGLLLVIAGAYLVALDTRRRLATDRHNAVTAVGIDTGEARSIPDDRTGGLRAAVALLVLAGVVFAGAAWIAYGSTRPDSPATPTPTGAPSSQDLVEPFRLDAGHPTPTNER